MTAREQRLAETFGSLAGPLARLERSLREDGAAVVKPQPAKSPHDELATDAFLQRFQQVAELTLRKLFPRLLAALEQSDQRHPLGAMLDRLDGLEVIADVAWWIDLNETRNRLIHEYALGEADRLRELTLAWAAAGRLHDDLTRLGAERARYIQGRP